MIRKAQSCDLYRILEIYEIGRQYMRSEGNKNQWGYSYPQKELLIEDISKNQLYVMYDERGIYGVFAFIIGEDPTYIKIYNGNWKRDAKYGAIHRICGDGSRKGILKECVEYCKQNNIDLRIDTHEDNKTMQKSVLKNGFEYCGIIYIEDGSKRKAYQYINR